MLLSLFLLLILFLLLLVKFSVGFKLRTSGAKLEPALTFGVGRFRVSIPARFMVKIGELLRSRPMGNVSEVLGQANTALRVLDHLLQEVDVLHIEIRVGLFDPFWTALSCGGFWTALGAVITALGSKPRFREKPEIAVHPDFNHSTLEVDLYCIFRFRVGQIIFNEIKRWTQA